MAIHNFNSDAFTAWTVFLRFMKKTCTEVLNFSIHFFLWVCSRWLHLLRWGSCHLQCCTGISAFLSMLILYKTPRTYIFSHTNYFVTVFLSKCSALMYHRFNTIPLVQYFRHSSSRLYKNTDKRVLQFNKTSALFIFSNLDRKICDTSWNA